MKKPPSVAFHIYRYQIIPLSQHLQIPLSRRYETIDQLKSLKNQIFDEALQRIEEFTYPRAELAHKMETVDGNIYVIRLAVKKRVTVAPEPFNEQLLSNWPEVTIVIDNNPSVQKIAIERNPKGFQNTITVAGIIEENLNAVLKEDNLEIFLEPTFEKNEFWAMVEKYRTRITQATFELISPNMANISRALTIDLAALNQTTNTKETKIELNSGKDSHLDLDRNNPLINGLVDYAAAGGGNITLRVKGLRRTIHTSKSIIEESIDEATLEGSAKDVASVFKALLK